MAGLERESALSGGGAFVRASVLSHGGCSLEPRRAQGHSDGIPFLSGSHWEAAQVWVGLCQRFVTIYICKQGAPELRARSSPLPVVQHWMTASARERPQSSSGSALSTTDHTRGELIGVWNVSSSPGQSTAEPAMALSTAS